MTAISLNVQKWLRLCRLAEQAALLIAPNTSADELVTAAGRLTTVTEPLTSPRLTALATSFRWDCTAFGMAAPEDRPQLAEGLRSKAALLRRMLTPRPEPSPVAVAVPVPSGDPQPWLRRADIGG